MSEHAKRASDFKKSLKCHASKSVMNPRMFIPNPSLWNKDKSSVDVTYPDTIHYDESDKEK